MGHGAILRHELEAAGAGRLLVVEMVNQLGASGAVGAFIINADAAVASLVRNSAGIYTLTMRDKFPAASLVGASIMHLVAGATPTNKGSVWKLDSADPAGAKTVVFRCEIPATGAAPGTPQDPPDNSILMVTLIFNRGKL